MEIGVHTDRPDILGEIKRAKKARAGALQVYLGEKNKTTLKYKYSLDAEKIRSEAEKAKIDLYIHANLTLNLARPVLENRRYEWMRDNLLYDAKCGKAIGAKGVVVHMGYLVGEYSKEEGIENMAKVIKDVLSKTSKIDIYVENSSGEGTSISSKLEDIKDVLDKVKSRKCKVCIDTCHAFTGGYDLRKIPEIKAFFKKIDKLFGKKCDLFHINDSAEPFDSRKDYHAPIGEGYLFKNNEKALKEIVKECKKRGITAILETNGTNHPREVSQITKMRGGNAERNALLIKIFEKLEKIYRSLGDVYRARAYRDLVITIKNYPQEITPDNLDDLEGITDKSKAKIREILEKGHLTVLEDLEKRRNVVALTDLTEISGIGPKKAKELVKEGIYNVESLSKSQQNLTEDQKLGLKYRKTLQKRFKKTDLERFKKILDRTVVGSKGVSETELAGSYWYKNRGDSLKDLDILFIFDKKMPKMSDIIKSLEDAGLVEAVFAEGDRSAMLIAKFPEQIHTDIRLVKRSELPFYRLHFSSGVNFSREIKTVAKSKGYKLNEYGLFYANNGKKVPKVKNDKDVFKKLGLEYKTMSERYISK